MATAALSVTGAARAQVKEEVENASVTIVRKGIDKEIEVINVDLLEEQAKKSRICGGRPGYNIFSIPLAAGVLAPWGSCCTRLSVRS